MKQQCIPDGFPKSRIFLIEHRKILEIISVSARSLSEKECLLCSIAIKAGK